MSGGGQACAAMVAIMAPTVARTVERECIVFASLKDVISEQWIFTLGPF